MSEGNSCWLLKQWNRPTASLIGWTASRLVGMMNDQLSSHCDALRMIVYLCICVCVCECVSLFHQSYPSQGSVSRPGQESWRVIRGAGLQRCTLTKHLFHKINASRLERVPENPGRLAFAATHLIPITRQTGSKPRETIWIQTAVVC